MMSNHNILKGGGSVDKFLDDYREKLKDNIYFEKKYNGVIIKFKLKLENFVPNPRDGNMYFSIPYLDEDMKEKILRNNEKFIHNPDDKKYLSDWTVEVLNPPEKIEKNGKVVLERKKILNDIYGYLKYESKSGKLFNCKGSNQERVLKDINTE